MLRSMYSGISGMKNFQTKLDVLGNNIANVNTYGYKKGRTTFQDLVRQQVAGATAPGANRGGVNAKQVGLGSKIGTIDTVQTAGSIQSTSKSYSIGADGKVNIIDANGNITPNTPTIELAKFANNEGLEKAGGNLFAKSVNSGNPLVGNPGASGTGTLVSSALEMSNVDLSEEFTDMIVAQRGFQANTRIITTSDEILQELVNLKR